MANPVVALLVAPLRAYQKYISPGLPRRCRYYPTCSSYAITALKTHGAVKGTLLSGWRILRCNPWSRGGVDHVPGVGRWAPDPWEPPDDWVGHDIEEKPAALSAWVAQFRGGGEPSRRVEEVSFSDASQSGRGETDGPPDRTKES